MLAGPIGTGVELGGGGPGRPIGTGVELGAGGEGATIEVRPVMGSSSLYIPE